MNNIYNEGEYTFPYEKSPADKDLTQKIRFMLKRDSEGRCTNAFEVISRVETLVCAYETIKNKSGNMVPGTDDITLDGIDKE